MLVSCSLQISPVLHEATARSSATVRSEQQNPSSVRAPAVFPGCSTIESKPPAPLGIRPAAPISALLQYYFGHHVSSSLPVALSHHVLPNLPLGGGQAGQPTEGKDEAEDLEQEAGVPGVPSLHTDPVGSSITSQAVNTLLIKDSRQTKEAPVETIRALRAVGRQVVPASRCVVRPVAVRRSRTSGCRT